MAIQFDVKSLERATSGTVFAGPARVKGLTISYASGGTVVVKDGGSGGTTIWSFTAPAAAGSLNVLMPGDGIRCGTDVYVALTSATATVIYG